MDHETTRTLADIFLAVAQMAALVAALVVFWWAYKLLDELTRIAGRIAKDVQAIRSQTGQESPSPQRPQRPH